MGPRRTVIRPRQTRPMRSDRGVSSWLMRRCAPRWLYGGIIVAAIAGCADGLADAARLNAASIETTRLLGTAAATTARASSRPAEPCAAGNQGRRLLMEARRRLLAGDPAAARECLEIATASGAADASATFAVAMALVDRGEWGAARALLRHAPGSEPALVARGRLVVDRQGWRDAVNWFETAVSIAPQSRVALEAWGQAQVHALGDLDGAIRSFEAARRLAADDTYLLVQIAQAHQMAGRDDRAAAALAEAAPAVWDNALAQAVQAGVLLRAGRVDNAGVAAARAVELSPLNPWFWQLLGDVRCRQGRPIDARTAWGRASNLNPALGRSGAEHCVVGTDKAESGQVPR